MMRRLPHLFSLIALSCVPLLAADVEAAPLGPPAKQELQIPLGGSKLVHIDFAPSQINISDSNVVDVKVVSRQELLINAKKLGHARVTAWTGDNTVHIALSVVLPTGRLRQKLQDLLGESRIRVEPVGNSIVLAGTVRGPEVSERATKLVKAHLQAMGQDNVPVMNFLSVQGRQQVQLRVKVAEVSRTAMRQLGFNAWLRGTDPAVGAGGLLAPGSILSEQGANTRFAPSDAATGATGAAPMSFLPSAVTSDVFGLFYATGPGAAFPISVALNLLQGKGFAKVLSEPTLVAYSGQEATFLAGGEFPILIPQGLGTTSVEFKKFGAQLAFSPTVMADDTIQMKVSVTVSERDQSAAITLAGTTVPGLSSRHSETTVRLKNGQSFAISGLLQDRMESTVSKIPILGDIPILGMLFRKNGYHRTELEMAVLVTANLVEPLRPGEEPPLPGEDEISDPGAAYFFLLGMEPAISKKMEKRRGKPAGPVGFAP